MESFKKLGISEDLIKSIVEAKFTEPTEIQAMAIPLAMAGKDIIGGSATGSGKTLAFGASIIDKAIPGAGLQALILTPTRELAEQITQALTHFSKHKGLHVTAVYGGVGIEPQIYALRRADIVVGTPGRILDHMERETIQFDKIKTLVLDEADRMLDMGFIDDVVSIIKSCPEDRQTFLFSATISQDISHLAARYMKSPEEVAVDSYVDPSKLSQCYYDVPKEAKFSFLVHLLKHEHEGLVMVFCNTRTNTDFVARNLARYDIEAMAIHGGLTQARRNAIMEHFHKGRVFVLVCTDVAARGLDIKGVSHVYNYDLPNSSKDYIHRIGRTARAGKDGKAISLVSNRDYDNFSRVLEDDSLKIERMELPEFERVFVKFGDVRGRAFGGQRRGEGRGRDGGDRRGGDRRGGRGGGRFGGRR
ncbi:MAG: DEAD/DEAH box helicase [archaeon]